MKIKFWSLTVSISILASLAAGCGRDSKKTSTNTPIPNGDGFSTPLVSQEAVTPPSDNVAFVAPADSINAGSSAIAASDREAEVDAGTDASDPNSEQKRIEAKYRNLGIWLGFQTQTPETIHILDELYYDFLDLTGFVRSVTVYQFACDKSSSFACFEYDPKARMLNLSQDLERSRAYLQAFAKLRAHESEHNVPLKIIGNDSPESIDRYLKKLDETKVIDLIKNYDVRAIEISDRELSAAYVPSERTLYLGQNPTPEEISFVLKKSLQFFVAQQELGMELIHFGAPYISQSMMNTVVKGSESLNQLKAMNFKRILLVDSTTHFRYVTGSDEITLPVEMLGGNYFDGIFSQNSSSVIDLVREMKTMGESLNIPIVQSGSYSDIPSLKVVMKSLKENKAALDSLIAAKRIKSLRIGTDFWGPSLRNGELSIRHFQESEELKDFLKTIETVQ